MPELAAGNQVLELAIRMEEPARDFYGALGGAGSQEEVRRFCALVYWCCGVQPSAVTAEASIIRSFWTSLYFSVVTFTTLGYGDLRPVAGFGRAVAAGEAVAGAFLMALFVVAMARKFTR